MIILTAFIYVALGVLVAYLWHCYAKRGSSTSVAEGLCVTVFWPLFAIVMAVVCLSEITLFKARPTESDRSGP